MFQIEDDAGSSVGQIARKWRGCCEETFTDSDTFKVEFPSGSDVTKKALLIAATILIVSSSHFEPFISIINDVFIAGFHVFRRSTQ